MEDQHFFALLHSRLETCAICYGKMRKIETHTTPCNHKFCRDCIQRWIDEKPTPDCPMCRQKIPDPLLELNADLRFSAGSGVNMIAKVKDLLKKGARANSVDAKGRTALHFAALSGNSSITQKSVMEILFQNGAEVDKADRNGRTALHNLIFHFTPQKESLVSFLLANRANVNARNISGQTPLEKGAEVNFARMDGFTPLHSAAFAGNESIAKALLAKNANINAQDFLGRTPLILAAKEGRANMVQMLLNNGANAALKTKGGFTARNVGHWSCQYALRHYDWVQFWKKPGSNFIIFIVLTLILSLFKFW